MTATVSQTRDPLPDGHTTMVVGPPCRTCNATEIVFCGNSDSGTWTRSADPDQTGRYAVQAHRDWCPVFTGTPAELGCPYPLGGGQCCGAPVESVEFTPGWWLIVPGAGPNGTDGHIRATPETEARHPGARRERAPMFDAVTVAPCGHTVEDDDARALMARVREVQVEESRRAAEALFAEHADLFAAAQGAGQGALVEAYRSAVLAGASTAPGLLMALRTVVAPSTAGGQS